MKAPFFLGGGGLLGMVCMGKFGPGAFKANFRDKLSLHKNLRNFGRFSLRRITNL